jgi:hypothetical protein
MRIVLAIPVEPCQKGERCRVATAARDSLLQQMERAIKVRGDLLAQARYGVSHSQVTCACRAASKRNEICVRRHRGTRGAGAPPD